MLSSVKRSDINLNIIFGRKGARGGKNCYIFLTRK